LWDVWGDVLQVELENTQWSYDPHVGFTINNPSLVHDHGYYECLARSTKYNNKNQTVSYFLIVQRKFKCAKPALLSYKNFEAILLELTNRMTQQIKTSQLDNALLQYSP